MYFDEAAEKEQPGIHVRRVNGKMLTVELLLKGWSRDKKYILTGRGKNRYLLRISDKTLYEKKKRQFEQLQKMEVLAVAYSRPIEFGTLEDGSVYMILSYLEGIEGVESAATYICLWLYFFIDKNFT